MAKKAKAARRKAAPPRMAARKAIAGKAILTDQTILVALTPAMRQALREAMQTRGTATIRLEPLGSIPLGRLLRAYPVVEPPN